MLQDLNCKRVIEIYFYNSKRDLSTLQCIIFNNTFPSLLFRHPDIVDKSATCFFYLISAQSWSIDTESASSCLISHLCQLNVSGKQQNCTARCRKWVCLYCKQDHNTRNTIVRQHSMLEGRINQQQTLREGHSNRSACSLSLDRNHHCIFYLREKNVTFCPTKCNRSNSS